MNEILDLWWIAKSATFFLKYTGNKENSDWFQNIERCFNILTGIEKCVNLRNSISMIELDYSATSDKKDKTTLAISNKYSSIIHLCDLKFKFKESEDKMH